MCFSSRIDGASDSETSAMVSCDMMRIEVLCFAIARDAVGAAQLELELATATTVGAVAAALAENHPALRPLLDRMRYAINEEFVPPTRALADGDTLALIPPVSGG
jgi:molybdopterin converting factor subunit 1